MKFVPAIAFVLLASTAAAQSDSDNYEMAKLGITMNGYDCEKVLEAQTTDNEDVLEITCQKTAGSDATVVYIFTIDGSGFSIQPK
ncbi:MAG: DUF4412 domain-containing protein [Rhodobacteraceae bacterium]|nr:DUF4412 domain-containing protein [Paracoccaceae bacterium]